jgi:hypothetical protein
MKSKVFAGVVVLLASLTMLPSSAAPPPNSTNQLTGFHMNIGEYGTSFKFRACDGSESTTLNRVRVETAAEGRGTVDGEHQVRISVFFKPEGSGNGSPRLLWDELSRHDVIQFRFGERELTQGSQALEAPSVNGSQPMVGDWYITATLYNNGVGEANIVDRETCEFAKVAG